MSSPEDDTTLIEAIADLRLEYLQISEWQRLDQEDFRFEVMNRFDDVLSASERHEVALAWMNTDLMSSEVAFMLDKERTLGYEFFGVHAEQWQDDPEIARAEQSLFELLDRPIRIDAWATNRGELEVWREMGSLYTDGSVISREDLLERAERVIQCTSGEIPANPPKRIWTVMAKSSRRRDQLRTKHLPFTARSVEKAGKAVPAKSAAKKVGPKGTAKGR
jgi:hypothetical protein